MDTGDRIAKQPLFSTDGYPYKFCIVCKLLSPASDLPNTRE
jgi:hypothetical protein